MTRRIRTVRPASEELQDAVRWYEERRRGLGAEFFDVVGDTLSLIAAHPAAGAPAFGDPDMRRVLIPRFPYQVVYRLRPSEIVIIAFAHLITSPRILEASTVTSGPPNENSAQLG